MSRTRRTRAASVRRVEKWHRTRSITIGSAGITLITGLSWAMLRPMFYDRAGEPLGWEEFAYLHSFRSYRRVAETTVAGMWVSTVWLGTDMSFGDGDPVIFETMAFPRVSELHPELREFTEAAWRYRSEEEAERGHAEICVDIRQMAAKIRMADEVTAEAIACR